MEATESLAVAKVSTSYFKTLPPVRWHVLEQGCRMADFRLVLQIRSRLQFKQITDFANTFLDLV